MPVQRAQPPTTAELRGLRLFEQLAEEDLQLLAASACVESAAPGDLLLGEGMPSTDVFGILAGEVEILRRAGAHEALLAVRGPGEIVGEMAVLLGTPRTATVKAQTAVEILRIPSDAFLTVLTDAPTALLALLRTVSERLQSTQDQVIHSQKMAALGTLAAGIAHELNNPAAALARIVDQLRDATADLERQAVAVGALSSFTNDGELLDSLRRRMDLRLQTTNMLGSLERAEREVELQEWLEQHGCEDAWRISPTMVDAGWTSDELMQLVGDSSVDPALLAWLAATQATYSLLHEAAMSARAISEIVTAVKSYTRLDQAPIQEVDIREGLAQALVILRYKLKGVQVETALEDDLPRLTAYAGELNQVWTNLIDNAADALDGAGQISIRAFQDSDWVLVEIEDNGPGIPSEALPRLFEPFFTTKPQGKGTGLGLSISYAIVQRHHGQLEVTSRPGRTCFSVRLPRATGIR